MLGLGHSSPMKTSIFLPEAPSNPTTLIPYARLALDYGGLTLWQGETAGTDMLQAFSFLAGRGYSTPVGLGVSLMPTSHPFTAALRVQTLAAATGRPVVAAFGPGSLSLQQRLMGVAYPRPLQAASEFIGIVSDLLHDGTTDRVGATYSYRGGLPVGDHAPIEIGLGVLRPGMAYLAGQVADVAVTWLTPASYIRSHLMPQLARGSELLGRPVPRVVSIVPVAVAQQGWDSLDAVVAGCSAHMQLRHYAAMLDMAGIHVAANQDVRRSAASLVDGGAFLCGTADVIKRNLQAFRDVGVNEVVLNVAGVYMSQGHQAALSNLNALLG
jgi:5,10-methylenetetrahydromethanopterin reductase